MILKRRDKPPLKDRIRQFLWPDRGFARAFTYIRRRVQRLNDVPEKIALGCAIGVFTSFTPFFGFHFVIAGIIAYVFRANILAGLLGTAFGNPLTFPLIATAAMSTGAALLGTKGEHGDGEGVIDSFVNIGALLWDGTKHALGVSTSDAVTWSIAADAFSEFASNVILPYSLGGMICGLPVAIASYFVARPMIAAYKRRRREMLARRKRHLQGRSLKTALKDKGTLKKAVSRRQPQPTQ